MSLVDMANSIMGTFTTFLGSLPIVGAILGTISNCISFGANAYSLVKASMSISRMREQKAKAKGVIETKGSEKIKQGIAKGKFDDDEDIVKEDIKRFGWKRGTKKVERSKRLDEKVLDMRQNLPDKAQSGNEEERAKQKELIHSLEDYDVTKELTSANKKRATQGIVDLILKDAVGIGTSLATLDPTGLGAGIGPSINMTVSAGYLVKEGASKVRGMARKHNWLGADLNKSEDHKAQRRHNLAVIMYDRMRKLKKHHYANLIKENGTEDEIGGSVDAFKTMDQRITAMGIAGPLFRAANDKNQAEMLKVMRQGFYRENG